MKKARRSDTSATVMFTLDPRVEASSATVCGDWNEWSLDADVMKSDGSGGFALEIDLETGRSYRFRYLLDGERWENDWDADAYVPNDFGGDDSVIDLNDLPDTPKAKKARAPRKATPSKASASEEGAEAQPAPATKKAPARKKATPSA